MTNLYKTNLIYALDQAGILKGLMPNEQRRLVAISWALIKHVNCGDMLRNKPLPDQHRFASVAVCDVISILRYGIISWDSRAFSKFDPWINDCSDIVKQAYFMRWVDSNRWLLLADDRPKFIKVMDASRKLHRYLFDDGEVVQETLSSDRIAKNENNICRFIDNLVIGTDETLHDYVEPFVFKPFMGLPWRVKNT